MAQLAQEALAAPVADPPTAARSRSWCAPLGAREIVPALKAAGLSPRAIEIDPLGAAPGGAATCSRSRARSSIWPTAWRGSRCCARPGAGSRSPTCTRSRAPTSSRAGRRADGVRGAARRRRLAAMSGDGRARLRRVRAVLDEALASRGRSTLRDAVEGAWLALGGPACAADATDLEEADAFLDHLEQARRRGRRSRTAPRSRRGSRSSTRRRTRRETRGCR